MKTKKNFKNSITYYLLIFILFCTSIFSLGVFRAFANEIKLDSSDVLEDLKTLDLKKYPYDKNGEMQLISFNEYCFSYYDNLNKNYGLYVYVYNPKALDIDIHSANNKIQIGFNVDDKGHSDNYENYNLQFMSKSTKNEYVNLFYKFKVLDREDKSGNTLYENAKAYLENGIEERRYAVSGITLATKDGATKLNDFTTSASNAVEYNVQKTYIFSGYAYGYGKDPYATGNLTAKTTTLETISLQLEHTFWRSKNSDNSYYNDCLNHQNQIDSVYFSIPNEFLKKYGNLQRIKAEWYELKTKDIIVISNEDSYIKFLPLISKNEPNESDKFGMYQNYFKSYNDSGVFSTADWSLYKKGPNNFRTPFFNSGTLYYLLPTKQWGNIENYDPYSDKSNLGVVSGNELLNYIYSYDKSFDSGVIEGAQSNVSADLFLDTIDEGRIRNDDFGVIQPGKNGISYYNFDIDEYNFDIFSYKPQNHSFGENSQMYGFWNALFGTYGEIEDDKLNIAPIAPLKSSDFTGNITNDSNSLLINLNDVGNVQNAVKEAENKKETMFLFRFGNTDYGSAKISLYNEEIGFIENQAYRARQTVFLNFDIIELTFKSDMEELTVIPVVSSPIDMAADVTPPLIKDNNNLGIIILIIIITVLVLIALCILNIYFPVFRWIGIVFKYIFIGIKYVFIGLWWVIKSPYLLVKWLIDVCKKE